MVKACALLALAILSLACSKKDEAKTAPDAAVAVTPPPPAPPPPPPPPREPEPSPLAPDLQAKMDAVGNDPLTSEYVRLLLEDFGWDDLEAAVAKRLHAASPKELACSYARVRAAQDAARADARHDPRVDRALGHLADALAAELDARHLDASAPACP